MLPRSVQRWFAAPAVFAMALLATQDSCLAGQAEKPGLDAVMAIWRYVFEIDATFDACRRLDAANARSYSLRDRFHREIDGVLVSLNTLLTRAGQRSGRGMELLNAAHEQKQYVEHDVDRRAAADPEKFIGACRALPQAATARKQPFRPLDEKFAAEKKLIQAWAAELNLLVPEGKRID
jgi:hypothetical protein